MLAQPLLFATLCLAIWRSMFSSSALQFDQLRCFRASRRGDRRWRSDGCERRGVPASSWPRRAFELVDRAAVLHDVRMLRLEPQLAAAQSCCCAASSCCSRRSASLPEVARLVAAAAPCWRRTSTRCPRSAARAVSRRSRSRLSDSTSACICICGVLHALQVGRRAATAARRRAARGSPPASSRSISRRRASSSCGLEELVRAFGQHLAIAQVLVDEQRRQPLGDPLRGPRIVGLIADAERVALDDVDARCRVRIRSTMSSMTAGRALRLGYRLKSVMIALEPRAAQDLLADRLQPILDARRHGRLHVALGHPLRHDQDQRLRAVAVGQAACRSPRRADDARTAAR